MTGSRFDARAGHWLAFVGAGQRTLAVLPMSRWAAYGITGVSISAFLSAAGFGVAHQAGVHGDVERILGVAIGVSGLVTAVLLAVWLLVRACWETTKL